MERAIVDKAAKRRWAILLTALGITIAAIVYPVEKADTAVVAAASSRASSPPKNLPVAAENDYARPELEDADLVDPFAPRGWQAPPPPPPPVAAQQAAAPIAPPAPAGPPPVPYKFMGRLNDGGVEIIYLSRGEQTLIARNGETLDGIYKVVGMDRQHIEFEYLPTGDKQTLPLPASDN